MNETKVGAIQIDLLKLESLNFCLKIHVITTNMKTLR